MGKAFKESRIEAAQRRYDDAAKLCAILERDGLRPSPAHRIALEHAGRDLRNETLLDRWGHKRGTPETYEKISHVTEGNRQSGIDRMHETGQISNEQHGAAMDICYIAESIERAVSVRSGNIEARVDCQSGNTSLLIESLGRVRLEMTYSRWRDRLPMPRRMVIDMVTNTQSLVNTARSYGVPWRKARGRLIDALDRWIDIREMIWNTIDEQDVASVHFKLGGILLPPMPKIAERELEAS